MAYDHILNPSSKGVALIIVLLIVAIVSVLATEMGGRLQLQIKRSLQHKRQQSGLLVCHGR